MREAFARSPAAVLLHLGSTELYRELPPSLAFGRDLAKLFFTRVCAAVDPESERAQLSVPVPADELEALAQAAPPMLGAEYLDAAALASIWRALEAHANRELAAFDGTAQAWLESKSPVWNAVGRVHFHLAENKGSDRTPFAFLATYATRVSRQQRVQHAPLGRAIEQHAGVANKPMLLALLRPVQKAAERSALVRRLVDSGELFHPLAWTPKEAYAFLQDLPAFEASGVVVRVPDWWHTRRPRRPQVSLTIGSKAPAGVGTSALLDFRVSMTLDGETLTPGDWKRIAKGTDGLVLIKGKWAVVDRERLQQVLLHWRSVEKDASDGLSFLEGMRLLAGAAPDASAMSDSPADAATWAQPTAGPWLEAMLADLQRPDGSLLGDPGDALGAVLRPYQRDGVAWLWLLSRLGLGACLADDMGLGKTLQVLALLLLLKRHRARSPHVVVVPASLLGNWRAEASRFAPSLRVAVAHASEPTAVDGADREPSALADADVVLTTYGTVLRAAWIRERAWGLVVLDEAQAIKNPDAKQTRAVKALKSDTRLALTGTPVENRLGDLWSIFDFVCPGLLGSAKAFRDFTKRLEANGGKGYAPLRALVRPYILRRMKTDRSIIADLPDKTELSAYCPLTKLQAALYQSAVDELAATIDRVDGIRRRGLVLAYLLRFKQICNHPSQWLGDGAYRPEDSGKLARLRELCEPIAARQDRALVFTQFREMTGPLSSFLEQVFGRPGLVLTGETAVALRAKRVAEFQADDGPPFFVLSLKAGGTGLNLTAATHVIHFDRWWNPAVEDQATDRAFRIGQKRNVLVHKFVCRGTVEEKIDTLMASKRSVAQDVLSTGAETMLTELDSRELLRLVSLDLRSALEEL